MLPKTDKSLFYSSASNKFIETEWLVLVGLVILIAITEYVGLLKPIRNLGEKMLVGLETSTSHITYSVIHPLTSWHQQQDAIAQLEQLKLQYSQAQATVAQLQSLRAENDTLRSLIASGSASTSTIKAISTPIIAYGQPMIAAGSNQKIFSGEAVLVGQTMVGVINQVSDNQSSVSLLSQEASPKILARTESGVTGIIEGNGKQVLLTEIPIDSKIVPGEKVVTQGQTSIRPNILLGTISQVKADPQAAVQTAVVEQIVSFYETTLVSIE